MGNPAGQQVGGNRAVERAQDLDEPIAVALHERLTPGAVVDRKAERQVVEELVGDHDTDDRPVGHDGDGLDTVRVRCPLHVGDLHRHVARSADVERRRTCRQDSASESVPGPAPASTTAKSLGRPRSFHQSSMARASTAPNSGPTSGEVMKSPRHRPARPPGA